MTLATTPPDLASVKRSRTFREYANARRQLHLAWQVGDAHRIDKWTDEVEWWHEGIALECRGYVHLIHECQRLSDPRA